MLNSTPIQTQQFSSLAVYLPWIAAGDYFIYRWAAGGIARLHPLLLNFCHPVDYLLEGGETSITEGRERKEFFSFLKIPCLLKGRRDTDVATAKTVW
jgi:hypothetical protein